jgi:uncharacterized protein YkwD
MKVQRGMFTARNWRNAARLASTLLLGLPAGCGPASGAQPGVHFGSGLASVPATAETSAMEHAMWKLLNRDRKQAGLGPLAYDEDLAAIARHQSGDMRDHHFFAHESPNTGSPDDRLDAASYRFVAARENLSEAPDVVSSQDGLMKSPHHFENIMAQDVTHVGVGIVQGGVEDPRNFLYTQLFARPSKHESASEVTSRVLATLRAARKAADLPPLKTDPQLSALAEQHVSEVQADDFESSVQSLGQKIPGEVSQKAIPGLSSVLVSGQLAADSTGIVAPQGVVTERAAKLGIAVRSLPGEKQRPSWFVLMVVGMK